MTVFLLKKHPSFNKKNLAHWVDIILWNSRNLWAIITSADWSPPLGGVAASPRPNPADQWSEQRPTSCFPSIATHWYLLAHYLPVRKKTRLIVGKCDTRWLDCSHPQDSCINYSDWSKLWGTGGTMLCRRVILANIFPFPDSSWTMKSCNFGLGICTYDYMCSAHLVFQLAVFKIEDKINCSSRL